MAKQNKQNHNQNKTEPKAKTYKVKSSKQLGFEKRNYFIEGKNYLIVAGAEFSEEDYNQFSDDAKDYFFV